MIRTLGTATFWANQAGIPDKTLRAGLDGFPPDGTRGKSQPTYYLSTVWAALQSQTPAGDLDPEQQRARKDSEQADKLAMQNAITRGEVAYVEDMDATWAEHIVAIRARLLAMPSKLAPLLVGQDAAHIAAAVKSEVYAALTELAEYEPPEGTA